MIAVDTETRSLRWWEGCAFLATWSDAEQDFSVPLMSGPSNPLRFKDPDTLIAALAPHDELVFHNAKFDIHQLRESIDYDVFDNGHTVHDTLLMAKVALPGDRWDYSLEALSEELLPDGGKADTKRAIASIYQTLTGRTSMAHDDAFYDVWMENPHALELYAMADTRDTLDLYHVLLPLLEEDERLMNVYRQELAMMAVLVDAERRGIRVDQPAISNLAAHHRAQEEAAASVLSDLLGVHVEALEGAGSDERVKAALQGAGVELAEEISETTGELYTPVNQYALAKQADHPAVKALLDWRHARKFQSTYLAPLEGSEVVHTDFMQVEARTSRMSSRRPNLQNLPKRKDSDADENMRLRSVYVPREGYGFVVSDYDQVEPRTFAWFNGVQSYRDLVARGDTYYHVAVDAWGGELDDYRPGGSRRFLYPAAKMIYLAILYGGGGKAIMTQNNAMTPPEYHLDVGWVKDPTNPFDTPPSSQALKKRIVAGIPGYYDLCSTSGRSPGRIMQTCQKNGFVRTLHGRKMYVPRDKEGRRMWYVMPNRLIQGSAAEIMKAGAINVAEALRPLGGYPLLFVHDEILCEVPLDRMEDAAPLVVKAMEAAYPLDPPLTADVSITERSYAHA